MNTTALIITSIAGDDHPVLRQYAREAAARDLLFLVVGDQKSPASFALPHCRFLSVDQQAGLDLALAEQLPWNHYARKNLGYLVAMQQGAEIIVETDDDNLPLPGFWAPRTQRLTASRVVESGWVNAYGYFTDTHIWPRGFALAHIRDQVPPLARPQSVHCPIQQGLAGENPDVDALYRLTRPLPVSFAERPAVALGKNSICPFNSQNTTWFQDAFMLLYLPSYCSFRMTDIWRSFVAQQIAWVNDWHILFHSSTVWQERNSHNLLQDFQDEIPGYLHNQRICQELQGLALAKGVDQLGANLLLAYQKLIDMGLVGAEEMRLVQAWIRDVEALVPLTGKAAVAVG